MKIERLRLHHVRIPLRQPFRISSGVLRDCERVLVEMSGDGRTGWGEVAVDAVPFYTWETVGTAWHIGRNVLGPIVCARGWAAAEELEAAFAQVRGHAFAKAGFEAALWDLLGQCAGRSVASLLGGTRRTVEVGPSIGIKERPQDTVRAVGDQCERGRRRIKIKVGPGRDDAYLAAVRESFPDVVLMADANSAYTPADMDRLVAWDRFHLSMIEQPFEALDLYYHAELCRRAITPICLDESIETLHLADCAIRMQAMDIINIKVGRVAGLVNARRIHDRCAADRIPVWIGTRVGTGVGEATALAAAALPGATHPSDAVLVRDYVLSDLLERKIPVRNGCEAVVPDTPGLGIAVDRGELERYTVESIEVGCL